MEDHLDFVEKQWTQFSEDGYNAKAVSAEWFVDAMQDLEERISVATETIAEAEAFAAKADSKTDSPKKSLPDSPDVRDLCRLLQKGLPAGKTQIEIAREFVGENDTKAKNLLRECRRFRHLWH